MRRATMLRAGALVTTLTVFIGGYSFAAEAKPAQELAAKVFDMEKPKPAESTFVADSRLYDPDDADVKGVDIQQCIKHGPTLLRDGSGTGTRCATIATLGCSSLICKLAYQSVILLNFARYLSRISPAVEY